MPYGPIGASATTFTARARRRRSNSSRKCSRRCSRCCDRLTLPDQKRIRGVQCNLWTEYIADIRHAQHMVLPRMAALAETGWANDRKDYNDFVRRIPALVAVYKAEGYNYAPYLFEGIE